MIENFKPQGFINKHTLCQDPQSGDFIFGFIENKLLLLKNGELPAWRDIKHLIDREKIELYEFGTFRSQACLLILPLPEALHTADQFHFRPVRFCHETLDEAFFRIAGLARQLHHWRSSHCYCGRCGTKTLDQPDERAKLCPSCQLLAYPQLYPCIIVLVTRGSQLLLARSPHFQPGIYSTLAGFIEPGESAENAVGREIQEEVKLTVKNIRYSLSQPWPFPNSLMLGFYAEYDSGEIIIDPLELEDAQWFESNRLPLLPSPFSISRLLIEKHLKEKQSALK